MPKITALISVPAGQLDGISTEELLAGIEARLYPVVSCDPTELVSESVRVTLGHPRPGDTAETVERQVDLARAQATAYVWGIQDGGTGDRDTGYSLEFGTAYGKRKRAYLTERAHFLPSIPSAFTEWRTTGTIA